MRKTSKGIIISLSIIIVLLLIVLSFSIGWRFRNVYYCKYIDESLSDLSSPYNHIELNEIYLYPNKICIDGIYILSQFNDTNSMDPTLDIGMNGIEKPVKSIYDIHIGDIISFKYKNKIMTHRIINIDQDNEGYYVETKGDNIKYQDFIKVRFEDIIGVYVGIIY